METIIDIGETVSYSARAALVMFESDQTNGERYLELHSVLRDGTMGEGRPVSERFIRDMLEGLSSSHADMLHGAVPDNVLWCDPRTATETLIWYNAPRKRMRYFAPELGLEDAAYHVPGTIYALHKGQIHVYCFEGRKPRQNAALLKGPFFNVYEDGRVCTGSVDTKMRTGLEKTFTNTMEFWENVFWCSVDKHTIGSPSTKHNLIETIKRYRDTPFDTGELVKMRDPHNLDSLIRKF